MKQAKFVLKTNVNVLNMIICVFVLQELLSQTGHLSFNRAT